MAITLNEIRQTLATNGAAVQFRMVDKFLNGSGSLILPRLYWIVEKSFSYEYLIQANYGSVTTRSLNTDYQTKTGVAVPMKEPMSIIGGDVKTDYAMIDVKGDAARQDQLDKKMIAAGKYFDKVFFNGDPTNPVGGVGARGNELRGLKVRAIGKQLFIAGANGGDLTLDLLDAALDAVVGPNSKKVIHLNRAERRFLSSLLRAQGRVTFTLDAERQVQTYDGATIEVVDEDENYNPILDFTETMGTSNTTTSVYITRFGESADEEFVQGIMGSKWMQLRPPANMGTYVLEVAESLLGVANFHPRSIARIAGLENPNG